jgi:hypothetical protein
VAVVIDTPLQHEWEIKHHLGLVQQHARAIRSHGYELAPRVLLDLLVLAASVAQSLKDINEPATGPDWALSEHFEEDMLLRRYGDEVVDAMDPLITPRGRHRVFRLGDWKLVQTTDVGTHLYDLATDPNENRDLGPDHPEVERFEDELEILAMGLAMPDLDADLASGEIPEMDPAAMEQLRALGYIE